MAAVNVFLTVDVECSIGGAFSDAALKPVGSAKRIFGRFHGREYGIPLMMDIAERYHVPLVFFVETFQQHYFGSDETRGVVDIILKRGHDIQLHLHPCFLNFTLADPRTRQFSDLCGLYPLENQIEMVAEAKNRLVSCGAPEPVAFRAGCFGANLDTLKALEINGLMIDSSYNQAYVSKTCLFPDMQLYDLAECSGIFEFPISQFREKTGLRASRIMHLDINGVSFEEMRRVLHASRLNAAPRNITILLHSFSFVKPYDVQYGRTRPRWNVIRRFEKLCRFLAENRESFQVKTFRELSRNGLIGMAGDRCDAIPSMPAWLSLARFGGQLFDRCV
jgi:hypothetical protein